MRVAIDIDAEDRAFIRRVMGRADRETLSGLLDLAWDNWIADRMANDSEASVFGDESG